MGEPTHPRRPQTLQLEGLPLIHPNAAAMDISADEIIVAIPPDRDPEPVRVYRAFTPDLDELVNWVVACRVDTVALESTGVYSIPIYDTLEQHGIVPYLVNARHVKIVPGRKTDWNDVQMNIQLERVLSDIMAVTGQAIIHRPDCRV